MQNKILIILAVTIFNCYSAYSFDSLLFKPLTANHLESRIGFFYQPTTEKLRLDIGHSLDLLNIFNSDDFQCRAGGDFFILSRLRSEGRMKFPVETSDFYFGLNCSGLWKYKQNQFSFRLRAAHISSHLVDGYTKDNIFIQAPFVYSREFFDIILAWNLKYMRPYIGATTIFSTIPKSVNRFVPQIGADFQYPIGEYIDLVGGYDFKLNGTDSLKNSGCNAFQIGLNAKLSQNIGISFNFYKYAGYSIHGMFYNQKENYNGFGIQINY